jgi:hypothetical protein
MVFKSDEYGDAGGVRRLDGRPVSVWCYRMVQNKNLWCYLLLVCHACLRVVVHGLLRMTLCVSKGGLKVLQGCDRGVTKVL